MNLIELFGKFPDKQSAIQWLIGVAVLILMLVLLWLCVYFEWI